MSLVNFVTRDPMLSDFFGDELMLLPSRSRREMAKIPEMSVDFMENERDYSLNAEMPGFKKEDINVHIDNGVLHIEATKSDSKETKDEKKNYYHKERTWGKVQRSFRLPVNADKDNSSVSFQDGVLHLSFPKTANTAQKKLTIS